jgi:uncharacterized protein
MPLAIHRHPDAAAFLDRALPWLLRSEAEHNLMLGVALRFREMGTAAPPDLFMATVEGPDGVEGCAFRTPGFKLVLTRMPAAAAAPLAACVAAVHPAIPAVLGPEPEGPRFARAWSGHTGAAFRVGMRQGIHRLDAVIAPPAPPPGAMRAALREDADRMVEWIDAFHVEAGVERPEPAPLARHWTAAGDLVLWDDGAPRCMAAVVRRTPHGSAIASVYTPPEARGRGYASALTAALSQRELARGQSFCCLFTDLANPTSNAIYRRIGYRPVGEVVDVVFESGSR